MPYHLQCFGRTPWFVDPPLGTSLGPQGGLNTAQKRRRRSFDGVSDAICLKIWFLKDVLNEITIFTVLWAPEMRLKFVSNRRLASNTLIIWGFVWNFKNWWKKVMRGSFTLGPCKSISKSQNQYGSAKIGRPQDHTTSCKARWRIYIYIYIYIYLYIHIYIHHISHIYVYGVPTWVSASAMDRWWG